MSVHIWEKLSLTEELYIALNAQNKFVDRETGIERGLDEG